MICIYILLCFNEVCNHTQAESSLLVTVWTSQQLCMIWDDCSGLLICKYQHTHTVHCSLFSCWGKFPRKFKSYNGIVTIKVQFHKRTFLLWFIKEMVAMNPLRKRPQFSIFFILLKPSLIHLYLSVYDMTWYKHWSRVQVTCLLRVKHTCD